MSGYRRGKAEAGAPTRKVVGSGPTSTGGTGNPQNPSPGRSITTGAGITTPTLAGSGFRAILGRRPGLLGTMAEVGSAGLRSRPTERATRLVPRNTSRPL